MTANGRSQPAGPRRVLILGAAGRDFHNFNTAFRGDPGFEVIGFTATQIPGVADRLYPAALAGQLYPKGIPIVAESRLEELCRERQVDEVVFAYSDVAHDHVMHLASRALAAGADYALLGPRRTMLQSRRPVIAVSAVRTGCGKSQIARWLSRLLKARGFRVAALRHPMPYGDLIRERVQRFASLADIAAGQCTAEEREEYEPHVAAGNVIFAGVDYAAILEQAEAEADLLVWDGGNNDFPFLRPDLHIVVLDALRPENVTSHHPGEAVLRMADIAVINKVDAAPPAAIQRVAEQVRAVNATAPILRAASPVRLDDAAAVTGRRVLVVDDGPTLTHGGMAYGAGYAAALAAGPAEIVDPRRSAAPEIAAVYRNFPHIGRVLPAMGYGPAQIEALRQTIDGSDAEVVVAGTPIDLAALTQARKRIVRARYDFAEAGTPTLESLVDEFLGRMRAAGRC
ncbi:MAG TPA: cyclic 2,3-diphosphoglycerate synthase [Alphaproteobacteria bacterium]|nr:cyclic 2,3-diphosphoglycerate synthase [Alphaproteobacteria bacterium]